ncbi:MAG: hypothetical protein IPP78_11195 [Holophagaceae bacterium]|nr:hypothetical protein [Holophagaceae bacterium]
MTPRASFQFLRHLLARISVRRSAFTLDLAHTVVNCHDRVEGLARLSNRHNATATTATRFQSYDFSQVPRGLSFTTSTP